MNNSGFATDYRFVLIYIYIYVCMYVCMYAYMLINIFYQSVMEYEEHEKRAWSVDFSRTEPSRLVSGSDDCKVLQNT